MIPGTRHNSRDVEVRSQGNLHDLGDPDITKMILSPRTLGIINRVPQSKLVTYFFNPPPLTLVQYKNYNIFGISHFTNNRSTANIEL